MANVLDSMDIKQIITLQLKGQSNRKIAKLLSVSRNTVNKYTQFISATDIPAAELLLYEPKRLMEVFTHHTTILNVRYEELMTYFEKVNQATSQPGFTFLFHNNEYKDLSQDPYSYTQFMEHYRRRYAEVKGSMKLNHSPGHEMYIDFAGKKLSIVNKETGEVMPVEVFVAILPNSQYTYVQACMSQKRHDLIECLNNAMDYYGGVTMAIVCDNLKSAVTKASKYEALINRSLKEFAQHYNCVINPTRTYSPQDKALVENAVNLAYQRIYYPMREMTFFTLQELNLEIRKFLISYNDLLFQRKDASRKELFQSIERPYLMPLPAQHFEMKDYKRAKVQKIGYVYFSPDKNYYSVPYRYIGKQTTIHYSQSTVEVFYNFERIALHKRSLSMGIYTTNKEHLASTHQHYSGLSPEYFEREATKHGLYVGTIIARLFAVSQYPEIAYKRATGIIQLHKQYGSERLNNACGRALEGEAISYLRIKNILINNLDTVPLDTQTSDTNTSHIPAHENIRGSKNYY